MIDTSPSLALVLVIAVLVGSGVYLVLERTLTRVVIGTSLITHGVNVLILMAGGRAGTPPLIGTSRPEDMSDPLPQAMVLTAIVISMSVTAFAMSMAYRSWQLNGHDEVQDDVEDRRIAMVAATDEFTDRQEDDSGVSLAEEAPTVIDETASDEEERSGRTLATLLGAPDGGATKPGAPPPSREPTVTTKNEPSTDDQQEGPR